MARSIGVVEILKLLWNMKFQCIKKTTRKFVKSCKNKFYIFVKILEKYLIAILRKTDLDKKVTSVSKECTKRRLYCAKTMVCVCMCV